MIRRIRTADDLTWLLAHTQAFPGGQITTLSLQKQRVFDEASGREITAGTAITTTIRYELAVRGIEGLLAMKYEHLELVGYKSHGKIAAPVAV